MPRLSLHKVSLAAKCQWLFGLAVVLIIAAALLVPWYQMNSLVDEIHQRDAQYIADAAVERLDLDKANWSLHEENVDIIALDRGAETDDPRLDDFLRLAIEGMLSPNRSDSRLSRQRDAEGRIYYRYVQAIRDDQDEPPHRLLGIVSVNLPAQNAQLLAWNALLILIAGALAGLLAVLVFYLIVTRLVLSPVRDLRNVAEQVSAGDLAVRSSINTRDEFEDLAGTFNQMLSNLQRSREELETINRSLDTRLGELAQRNVDLYESNRMQAEFLANVSHELRTPLSSIIGFAELLRDAFPETPPDAPVIPGASDGSARLQRYATNILQSGRSLLDLINDLLDLAKIEAGRMRMYPARFSLADICQAVIDFTRPLVEKKDITVQLDLPPDMPQLNSDSGKVQQILYNLMSNAIKFTPERGRIGVNVQLLDADRLTLAVSDTGPGIPPDKQASIFEKFRQLDASVTREQGGTGLGLAISRELAHLLGGTLTIFSEPGTGSTFTLTIPLNCPEEVDRPLIPLNR